MATKEVKRVTISLPADSLAFADGLAETWSTTRSVVVRLLKQEEARVQALMKEGYLEMSSENHRDAEAAFGAIREVMTTDGS